MDDEKQIFLESPAQDFKKQQAANPYVIPASIVVAGVLIAAAVIYSDLRDRSVGTGTAATAGGGGNKQQVQQVDKAVIEKLADKDPVLGNPGAPVTIVEFGDFQCPFCGRFFKTTEQQIIEKYVKTGKVKFVYRDFAFLGQESEWAAEAAECANEQGKFWQYHDYLYNNQQGENGGAFSKDNLKIFAKNLGLNQAQFDSCLDSDKYLEEVRKDTEDGRNAGVNGTPTSFINGIVVNGAVPFSQFEEIIEAALKGQ